MGCNIGLLLAFAERSGGIPGIGVDLDVNIIEGTKLISEAFDTHTEFLIINFDSQEPWEKTFRF